LDKVAEAMQVDTPSQVELGEKQRQIEGKNQQIEVKNSQIEVLNIEIKKATDAWKDSNFAEPQRLYLQSLERQLQSLERQLQSLKDDRNHLETQLGHLETQQDQAWKVSLRIDNAKTTNSIRRVVYFLAGQLVASFPSSHGQTHRDFVKYEGESLIVELWFQDRFKASQFETELDASMRSQGVSTRRTPSPTLTIIASNQSSLSGPIQVVVESNYVPSEEPESGGKDTVSVHSHVSTAVVDSDFRKYQSIESGIEFKTKKFQKAHLIHAGKCGQFYHPIRDYEKISETDASNMICLSSDLHSNFDGNQQAKEMETTPSLVIELGEVTQDVDVNTNRSKVNLIVKFREDLEEGDYVRFRQMLGKNGVTFNDSKREVYTFVHVLDKDLFEYGIQWKQNETRTLWKNFDQMDLYDRR
jgi:hypothetical protein